MAHWYVVGASDERLAEMRAAGHLVDAFDGPLDSPAQSNLWNRIAASAPDALWVTWESLQSPDMAGLRRLRIAQPRLKILIEVPPEMQPPNPDLAKLVDLGIYGIFSAGTSFDLASTREWSFADASQWHAENVDYHQITTERKTILVASPNRPIVIAVIGIAPGVGTSCTAVGIAERLTALEQRTILAEADYAHTTTFRDWNPALKSDIAGRDEQWAKLPQQRIWSYIVVDGHLSGGDVLDRADLVVLVGPGAAHRWGRWTDWQIWQASHQSQIPLDDPRTLLVVSPHRDARAATDRLADLFAEPAHILLVPEVEEEDQSGWDAILQSVMPAIPEVRKKASWWKRKR